MSQAKDADVGRPTLTEADQRSAIATLRQRAADGAISGDRLQKLTALVWQCNTPHELYRRTHGLLGERKRRDTRARVRVVLLWVAVLLAMVVVTWFTAMAAKDGLFGNQP